MQCTRKEIIMDTLSNIIGMRTICPFNKLQVFILLPCRRDLKREEAEQRYKWKTVYNLKYNNYWRLQYQSGFLLLYSSLIDALTNYKREQE